jgi:predicted enzyme related to lactoylglutathione lyase
MDMGNSGGRFVWYELSTTDVEAAKAFYSAVVGWKTAETSAGPAGYTLFMAGDTPAAGLTKLPEALRARILTQWSGYIGVGDVDAAAARVKQLGGTIYIPPTDLPNASRLSIIADPQMAMLALVKAGERNQDESNQPGAPGRVAWHELRTSDLDKAFAFYSALFGWNKTHAYSGGPQGIYQNFAIGTETVGGFSLKPADWPRPLWSYYINVAGIEAAAKRVRSHGGQVLEGPAAVPGGAWVLHCRDPQGVPFSLIDTRVGFSIGCYSPRNQGQKDAP